MLSHMRTTLMIPDELYGDIKVVAAENKCTVTSVVEEALFTFLRQYRERVEQDRSKSRFQITGYGTGGTLPGVDLTSNAALLELMEDDLSAMSRR
jgi:hypothetical protein